MGDKHIEELLEALRGKTIIDRITFVYDTDSTQTLERSNHDEPGSNLDKFRIELAFPNDFLTYVRWSFYSVIERLRNTFGYPAVLEITAHQIFVEEGQSFNLVYERNRLVFYNRRNIEDTLFLDIQRYCEQNRLNYEVK